MNDTPTPRTDAIDVCIADLVYVQRQFKTDCDMADYVQAGIDTINRLERELAEYERVERQRDRLADAIRDIALITETRALALTNQIADIAEKALAELDKEKP